MDTFKRIFQLLLIGLITSFYGLAQAPKDFMVSAGEVVVKVIPTQEQYRFPAFESGKVYFRDNTFIRATLNYNLLYGEMQFINHKGDTLSLKEEHKLKLITVGQHVFYHVYKLGYLEVVSSYPEVKLVRKQHLELARSEVELTSYSASTFGAGESGLNGQFNTGSVIKGKDWKLRELYTQKAPGELKFEKKTIYILVDKNDRFYPANKNTVMKLFSKHKNAIDAYLEEYQPDFNLRNDLQGLLAFCSQLDAK